MASPARTVPANRDLDDLTLARAQRGDEAAFRELVRRYGQTVFAFLWRMLGHRAERMLVEDLTQETFVRVHRALAGFSLAGPARLETWILKIATRVAHNELRKKPVATEPLESYVAVDCSDARLAMIVCEALEQMTPDHRAILVLREYHELDYAEIAEALGIDLGTVRSRLSRARDALRAALSEES